MAWSMKKRLFSLLLAAGLISLTACGAAQDSSRNEADPETHQQSEESQAVPEVKMKVEPEEVTAGQTVEIRAVITQNGKPVNDADSVSFEIWKVGSRDEGEKIDAERTGDGAYSIEKTFQDPGDYKVMYHVTARGNHVMKDQGLSVHP
ncbi:FixH family protein [Paludifilum halophilum]|uniref:YtkA-like domain-containing protein n=1 Tax=Paludifilum halophilum TaxID=1642702 RepID=A0A235B565_9BACL|nr:FixH family protein [Paludifilum halophilum]OYD07448.1 hypothetical protein CHM34_11130 [Paludifilum halophilum]